MYLENIRTFFAILSLILVGFYAILAIFDQIRYGGIAGIVHTIDAVQVGLFCGGILFLHDLFLSNL